jgi:hypothetical protein
MPGMMADENLTLVLGMAMKIQVKTADVAINGTNLSMNLRRGSMALSTLVRISVELRKIDIPEVTTTRIGTNRSVIM